MRSPWTDRRPPRPPRRHRRRPWGVVAYRRRADSSAGRRVGGPAARPSVQDSKSPPPAGGRGGTVINSLCRQTLGCVGCSRSPCHHPKFKLMLCQPPAVWATRGASPPFRSVQRDRHCSLVLQPSRGVQLDRHCSLVLQQSRGDIRCSSQAVPSSRRCAANLVPVYRYQTPVGIRVGDENVFGSWAAGQARTHFSAGPQCS